MKREMRPVLLNFKGDFLRLEGVGKEPAVGYRSINLEVENAYLTALCPRDTNNGPYVPCRPKIC